MDALAEGLYDVSVIATDMAGNDNNDVTVDELTIDTTSPLIILSGDVTINLECRDDYVDAGATASDTHDGDLTGSIVVGGDVVDTGVPGLYTITYNVSDVASNAAVEVTRDVTISDTTAPVIALVGNASVAMECGDSYSDAGATASDACDGDLTAEIEVGGDVVDVGIAGVYIIKYNVKDAANNAAAEITRTVNVEDTIIPVITLLGDDLVILEGGGGYVEAGAAALDECNGDLTGNIVIGGDIVDSGMVGVYVITYNVNDISGNSAEEVVRTVNVSLPHPADLNNDFRMVMGEAIVYIGDWQLGSNPMANAIRAATIWQNGEYYTVDYAEECPLCWSIEE